MANVLNRTTKQYITLVNTPDFPTAQWIVNPDLSAVVGFPSIYWIITGDVVTLMTPAQRTAVDDTFPALKITSSAALEDGVPTVQANGVDVQTITIQKVNLVGANINTGSEAVRIIPTSPATGDTNGGAAGLIAVSNTAPALVAGTVTVTIGPTKQVGEVRIVCLDPTGAIVASAPLRLRFRSAVSTALTPLPVGLISGGVITAMTNSTVTVGPGTPGGRSIMRDRQNTYDISFLGTLTADMAVSGAGGLMTGAVEAANTWYAVMVIADTTEVNSPALMFVPQANVAAPTMPAGYNVLRRVGWLRNNASSDFLNVFQSGISSVRNYRYDEAIGALTALTGGTATAFTAVSLASLLPPSCRNAYIQLSFVTAVATDRARIRPTGSTTVNPPLIFRVGAIIAAGMTSTFEIVVNASQSLDYAVDNAADALTIVVLGYLDEV